MKQYSNRDLLEVHGVGVNEKQKESQLTHLNHSI